MNKKLFNKYIGISDSDVKFSNTGIKKYSETKTSFTDEYIETLATDERFINALLSNDNFIKGIVGGNQ